MVVVAFSEDLYRMQVGNLDRPVSLACQILTVL